MHSSYTYPPAGSSQDLLWLGQSGEVENSSSHLDHLYHGVMLDASLEWGPSALLHARGIARQTIPADAEISTVAAGCMYAQGATTSGRSNT